MRQHSTETVKGLHRPFGTKVDAHADGRATVWGIDYGGKTTVEAFDDRTLLIRVAAHKAWVCRGQHEYVPARILVYRITKTTPYGDGAYIWDVEGMAEIGLGRNAGVS